MIIGSAEVPEYLQNNRFVELTRMRRNKATGILELDDGSLFDVNAYFNSDCLRLQVKILPEISDETARRDAAAKLAQKALADPSWGDIALDLRDGEIVYQAVFNVERTTATVDAFFAEAKAFLGTHPDLDGIVPIEGGDLDLSDIGLGDFFDGVNELQGGW